MHRPKGWIFVSIACAAMVGRITRAASNVPAVKVGAFSQEIREVFTKADGLADDNVRDVAVAPDGTVYAATGAGLCRYDGHQWISVKNVTPGPVTLVATSGQTTYAVAKSALYGIVADDVRRLCDGLPASSITMAARGQDVWVGGPDGLFRFADGRLGPEADLLPLLPQSTEIRQIALAPDGQVAVAARAGLFVKRQGGWSRLLPADGRYSWAVHDARGVAFDGAGRLWFCSPQGAGCLDAGKWSLFTGLEGLPYNNFTCVAAGPDAVWFGTKLGAIRYDGKKWHYRQGRRWLPDDAIAGVAVDGKGSAWFATPKGVGRIGFRTMTLAEKAKYFEDIIDKRHRRTPYGFVLECHLEVPGDVTKVVNEDSDNDGLWTGMYGAGECFAYGATKDPAAKRRAKAAFEALKFLCDVTQGGEKTVQRGFPARSILPTDGRNPNDGHSEDADRKRREGDDPLWKVIYPRWPKSADGKWYWKCDTSSDELDGHYFMNALYYDLVAEDEAEKARVRKVICDTTDHLMRNRYGLVDWDGQRTRWAYFGPHDLNHDPHCWEERGMNSLGILSYLAIAQHVSGDEKYARARQELVAKHGYAINAFIGCKIHDGPGTGNQSDDEMTIMRFFTLLRYETDPKVKDMMAYAFHRYWRLVRRERNPFFNFLYAGSYRPEKRPFWNEAYSMTGDWLRESIDMLEGQPLDLVNWHLTNSHRLDILAHHEHSFSSDERPSHGYLRDGGVIPIENRYVQHWSEDVWRLDEGGDGRTESDGAFWLMAYYAGKYLGFIAD
ncbi:MAG: hypothetical protein JXQ73_20470 [Phycisphaerae bacterium]|nr:hypothetical protein [Phycisphaerae bacterium]